MSKDCHDNAAAKAPSTPKPNEFADFRENVANTAYNLEHHQNNAGQQSSINAIFNEVYGTALKGKSESYKAAFIDFVDRKLDTDEKKGAVLDAFAQENFNFLSNGKKRIQTRDLDGKADEFGLMGRGLEQRLTEDLSVKQEAIEKSKHEGVFLGLGHKHGIDRQRLSKFDEKEDTKNSAENVLRSVGTPYEWDRLTGGTPYRSGTESMTRSQLEGTANLYEYPASRHPYITAKQEVALDYVDNNFKKMSTSVPTYDGGSERIVTLDTMNKYAKKHGAGWDTIAQNRADRAQYLADMSRLDPTD